MPSTHVSLHLHVIFSTRKREPWFEKPFQPKLHKYLAGIISGLGAHPRQVGGTADHVHLLFDPKTVHSLSYLVQEIKKGSSGWVRSELNRTAFQWQEGYGAFTVSPHQIPTVAAYIRNQEEHHRQKTFQEEYVEFLEKAGVEFKPEYLW